MVAVRFEGELCGMSENEWAPLPDSGRRSKNMASIRPVKRREVHQGVYYRKVGLTLTFAK